MKQVKTLEEITKEAGELASKLDLENQEVICLYVPGQGVEFSCSLTRIPEITFTQYEAIRLTQQISALLHGKDIALIDTILSTLGAHVDHAYQSHLQHLDLSQGIDFIETASNATH